MTGGLADKLGGLFRIGRAIRFVWDGAPFWTVVNVVVTLVQGILPLLTLLILKHLIDAVTMALKHSAGGVHRVIVNTVYLGATAVVTAFIRSIGATVSEIQSQQVTDNMQELLHERSVAADMEYYEDTRYYDTLHRAQREAPLRPTHIVNNLVQIGQNAISLIGIASLLFVTIHWQFALVLLAAVIPGVLVKLSFANRMCEWQRINTVTERRVHYYDWLITGDIHAKELRIFSLGKLFIKRARDLRTKLRTERFTIVSRRSLSDAIAQTIGAVVIYGAFGYLAAMAAAGAVTLGALVMFYQAFMRGQAALQDMMNAVSDLYENGLFLRFLYEFLDLRPKLSSSATPVAVPWPMRGGIKFEHVSFHYANSERPVLLDVNFEIRPGEVVALVGENGSGKTTLIKLLFRLYDPTGGKISIDNTTLDQFDIDELRRSFSVVFQDYGQYSMSARENIWLGDTTLPENDEMVEIAARKSGADGVIDTLPEKYETKLGYAFDNGTELSDGQWQKIALARSFARDAQIVVLDEPTSSLDAMSEHRVFEQFRDLVIGKTAILISHRLSSVRMADRILVLDGGRIVEQGSHDELMRLNGLYAHLFETQAHRYLQQTPIS